MSMGLFFQWMFPIVLLPALLTVPLVVAGKCLAFNHVTQRFGTFPLWILAFVLSWGGAAYILFVPAGEGGTSWFSWYLRLLPLALSGIPAGMLWARRTRGKWFTLAPTGTAFLFLLAMFTYFVMG